LAQAIRVRNAAKKTKTSRRGEEKEIEEKGGLLLSEKALRRKRRTTSMGRGVYAEAQGKKSLRNGDRNAQRGRERKDRQRSQKE